MKKVLTIVLSLLIVAALFTGCSNKTDEPKTPEVTAVPTVTPTLAPTDAPTIAPTEVPAPISMIAPDTKFNAYEQFDKESATGENVPWIYSFTTDKGVTFDPCTIMEASETLFPWHPWGGNWTGVGNNYDVPNLIELNTDMKDGINGALGFKAPADGSYALTGYVANPWDQPADLLYCRLNGIDLFTVQPAATAAGGAVPFPQTTVDLKAGDIVYFFCPSTTDDDSGWVSAYVDVNFYYEPTTVPEAVLPAASAPAGFDAFAQFDSTSATGVNVPWTYKVTSDEGATFTPCTVVEAQDKLIPWHPVAGEWTGVGLNGDVPDFVELNTDFKGGTYGALGFKAPEDGNYTISVNVKNVWEQTAELLHARLNGTDLFTVEPSQGADAAPAAFEQTGVALKTGEEVFFFCPSTTADGWVSAYVQVVITKE